MIFTSTRDSSLSVTFSQAVKQCVPKDGGVFVPSASSIEDLRKYIYYIDEKTSFNSIAGTITSAFLRDEYSPIICEKIATSAFPFEPVFSQIDDNLFHLELTNGYTGCHRDYGVSFLCSYLEATNTLNDSFTTLFDFTNGELGALLAKVLRNKKHIKAVLVYRQGTVKGLEEQDLIWNGGNIYPIEMEGTEEQIKNAISTIFEDKDFVQKHNLSVANTTNVCRLLAQVFCFPYSFSRLKNKVEGNINYACDAGNFSTLMAGLYSWRFCLPLSGIYLPSTSELYCDLSNNPVVNDYFDNKNKKVNINPTHPANLERLESFFENNQMMMRNFVYPTAISTMQQEIACKELYKKYGIFSDVQTSCAYATIKENSNDVFDEGGAFVLISQKHPSLSSQYCKSILGEVPTMPENIRHSLKPVVLNRPVVKNSEELKKLI